MSYIATNILQAQGCLMQRACVHLPNSGNFRLEQNTKHFSKKAFPLLKAPTALKNLKLPLCQDTPKWKFEFNSC